MESGEWREETDLLNEGVPRKLPVAKLKPAQVVAEPCLDSEHGLNNELKCVGGGWSRKKWCVRNVLMLGKKGGGDLDAWKEEKEEKKKTQII